MSIAASNYYDYYPLPFELLPLPSACHFEVDKNRLKQSGYIHCPYYLGSVLLVELPVGVFIGQLFCYAVGSK